uniref:Ribonuclease HII n=1 Tax=Geoglobus ahangari TaxID=113653 RepID=A0A7C3UI57_9EURY
MIAGIDEAGKGSVIGPMVVCVFACEENEITTLRELGVKDSKKIQKKKRELIAKELMKRFDYRILVISAKEINRRMETETINEILRDSCLRLIDEIDAQIFYIDSFDVNPERLSKWFKERTSKKVFAIHKGERYEVVAAASIIAKYERDRLIEELKKEFGDFGSGYPSDKKTVEWLKENSNAEIVRRKWKTLLKVNQKRLSDYAL